MSVKDWALGTSLAVIAILLVTMLTTTPMVVKECDTVRPLSAGVVPGDGYKTWGEIKHLIEDEEYAR